MITALGENAFDLSYSGLSDMKGSNGLDRSDLVMTNKTSSSVFAELLNQHICMTTQNDESTIATVARKENWIYVTVLFMYVKRSVEQGKKQKAMEKTY